MKAMELVECLNYHDEFLLQISWKREFGLSLNSILEHTHTQTLFALLF